MRGSTGICRYRSSLLSSCRSSHQVAPASASVAIVSPASAGSAGLAPPRTISNGLSAVPCAAPDVSDHDTAGCPRAGHLSDLTPRVGSSPFGREVSAPPPDGVAQATELINPLLT